MILMIIKNMSIFKCRIRTILGVTLSILGFSFGSCVAAFPRWISSSKGWDFIGESREDGTFCWKIWENMGKMLEKYWKMVPGMWPMWPGKRLIVFCRDMRRLRKSLLSLESKAPWMIPIFLSSEQQLEWDFSWVPNSQMTILGRQSGWKVPNQQWIAQ